MTIRMFLICLVIASSSCFGQSKIKLVVNVEEEVYRKITNKRELAKLDDIVGHHEKFYKKQKIHLGEFFNVQRATFLNAIITGKKDTISFKIVEKSTGNIVYTIDSLVVNGNFEIKGSALNEAILAHTEYDSKNDSSKCSTWDENAHCELIILIIRNNKIIIEKPFTIHPIIG